MQIFLNIFRYYLKSRGQWTRTTIILLIHTLSRRSCTLYNLPSVCGGRGNRTPKAFQPSCFQDSVLVHSGDLLIWYSR